MTIRELLEKCKYEFVTISGLAAYDTAARITPENAIELDFSVVIKEIDEALSDSPSIYQYGLVTNLTGQLDRIRKILDQIGVPKERQQGILRAQKTLTVEQRVQCVVLALLRVCGEEEDVTHPGEAGEMLRSQLYRALQEVETDEVDGLELSEAAWHNLGLDGQ